MTKGGENIQLIESFSETERSSEKVDIDEAIERAGFGFGTLLYIIGPVLFFCLEGAEVVMLTVVAPILRCEWNLSSFSMAVLLMSTLLSMTVSGGITSSLGDRFGRKPIALTAAIGVTVTGALCAFTNQYWQFITLRIVIGFFMGMGTGPVIALSGEVVPRRLRAAAFSVMPIPWGFGVSIGAGIAYFVIEPFGWQGLLLSIALVFSPCIIFLAIVNESPRYDYYYRRDLKSAELTIKRIHKYNGKGIAAFALEEPDLELNEVINFKMVCRTLTRTNNVSNSAFILTLAFFAVFNYYLYVYITPRLLNEGYCSAQPVTVKESCTFDSSVLFNLGVICLAGPIGSILSLILQEYFGRRKVFIGYATLAAVTPISMYFCVNHIYLVTFLVLLRAIIDGTCLGYMIIVSEYMPTVIRSFMISMAAVLARLGGVVASFSSEFIYGHDPRLGFVCLQGSAIVCVLCLMMLRKEMMGTNLT